MIIQKVIKGIGGLGETDARQILEAGIVCRWWLAVDPLPQHEIPLRLTERNLTWHQNRYSDPDPEQGNRPFCERTPFISTTAGTVERDTFYQTNVMQPAWLEALRYATNAWKSDGYLFYCYLFTLGQKAIGHRQFAEELRELNIYTGYSPYQPEGEITAKIIIPPSQIEKAEFWPIQHLMSELAAGQMPRPSRVIPNANYLRPENYANVRNVLT